jgi:opacity protein-like surface antigen
MKAIAMALGVASLAAASLVHAQATTGARTGMTMPYERGFWNHVGVSYGRSDLDASCISGFSCDDRDRAFRVFAGGRMNNIIGAEIGWVSMGEFSRGGGQTDAQALDLVLTAGIPFGPNNRHSVFGKIGTAYTRAEVSGGTAGTATGKEDGWDARYGLGVTVGLTDQWALRGDWDRFRVQFPGTKTDVDLLTLGAQYRFQ